MNFYEGYRISSQYGGRVDPLGERGAEFHRGIDLVQPKGSPVYAFVPGEVLHAQMGQTGTGLGNYGNVVAIKDKYGHLHCYCHLDCCIVTVGQYVERNQMIGGLGATGRVTGPHLHYEVREKCSPSYGWHTDVDPTDYLENYFSEETEVSNMLHIERIKRDQIAKAAIIRAQGTGETLEQMYARLPNPKPKYLVNGGYFNMTDGWTLSALKIDGKIIRDVSAVPYGYVLAGTDNTIKIHTMGEQSFLEVSDPYDWAIEMPLFAPEVMGVPAAALGTHERSAIGYDAANEEWVLGATDEGNLLYCHDLEPSLGVSSGILLDGGGSTNMLKDGECVNEQNYRRPVANAIAIWVTGEPEHKDSDVVTWGDLRALGLVK